MQSLHFSQQGFDELKKELAQLKEERKPAILDLSKARDMGDLRENGYYKSARMKVNDIDRRIRHLEHLVKYGKVYISQKSLTVMLGSQVTLAIDGSDIVYTIVGAYEADPQKGKISDVSPLGGKLFGKKVGDSVEITTPNGEMRYTITAIV